MEQPQDSGNGINEDKRKAWTKNNVFMSSSQLLDLLKDKTALQDPGQDPDAAEDVVHEMSNGHATAIGEELASAPEASEIEQCNKPEADGQEIDPFDCACSAEEVDPIGATNDDFAPEEDLFTPDEDPIGDVTEDIFSSQTEEEARKEAAIEAAVIRTVFGKKDINEILSCDIDPDTVRPFNFQISVTKKRSHSDIQPEDGVDGQGSHDDASREDEEGEENSIRQHNSKKRRTAGGVGDELEQDHQEESEGPNQKHPNVLRSIIHKGTTYSVGQHVLVDQGRNKPQLVQRIQQIWQGTDGKYWLLGQRYYRPNETSGMGGRMADSRHLLASDHVTDSPFEMVAGLCEVVKKADIADLRAFKKQKNHFYYQSFYYHETQKVRTL